MKVPNRSDARASAFALALFAGAVGLGAVGGCAAVAPGVEQTPADSARTVAAVKGALIEALGVDGAAVGATIADGRLTLDGFVADERQRDGALAAAREAGDGMPVVDALQVRR